MMSSCFYTFICTFKYRNCYYFICCLGCKDETKWFLILMCILTQCSGPPLPSSTEGPALGSMALSSAGWCRGNPCTLSLLCYLPRAGSLPWPHAGVAGLGAWVPPAPASVPRSRWNSVIRVSAQLSLPLCRPLGSCLGLPMLLGCPAPRQHLLPLVATSKCCISSSLDPNSVTVLYPYPEVSLLTEPLWFCFWGNLT